MPHSETGQEGESSRARSNLHLETQTEIETEAEAETETERPCLAGATSVLGLDVQNAVALSHPHVIQRRPCLRPQRWPCRRPFRCTPDRYDEARDKRVIALQ